MDTFIFKDKKMIIYGAGSIAKVLVDVLLKENIFIAAYVDKRAHIIGTNNGIPVIDMDQLAYFTDQKDEYAILITIRNVFEHSKLASLFYDIGYRNIVYKPKSILQGIQNDIQQNIDDGYELLTAKFQIPKSEIACYEEEPIKIVDSGLQRDLGEQLLVNLPAELLFSNVNHKIPVWSRQNFISNYIAVDLYKAFSEINPEMFADRLDRYINNFALPGAKTMGVNTEGNWRELLIDARQKVYDEMDYSLNMNPEFFSENCTTVKYCEKNGFELIASGKNRVSFLIAKGYQYIPVKIGVEDYTKYVNFPLVSAIYDYLKKNNRCSIFAKIPHPYFYQYQVTAVNYLSICVAPIARSISNYVYNETGCFFYNQYKIVLCINDEGYASRYFRMLGYQVERNIIQNLEVTKLLDTLFYFDRKNDFPILEGKCQFSVISTEFDVEKVSLVIKRTLFISFLIKKKDNENTEIETVLMQNGFINQVKFMETVWNGQCIEGWMYTKQQED